MLSYKTQNRPGLVTLYDIWPGNRAGLFLQPRSPHAALGFVRNGSLYYLTKTIILVKITTVTITKLFIPSNC